MQKLAQLFVWSATRPRPSHARKPPADCLYEDIQFLSATDGTRLSGWLIHATGTPIGAIVLCHGHTSTRSEMTARAALLSKHHFTTLVFDFRARGMSGGDRCTLGLHEADDVIGAVEYITRRPDTCDLPQAAIGNSMGGAAVIYAAARDCRIRAVVAEATFARLSSSVAKRTALTTGPLAKRLAAECGRVGIEDAQIDISSVNPVDVVAGISPRPLLLITDGIDFTCSRQESDRLYEAAGEPKQRWIAAAAPHCAAFHIYPEKYMDLVTAHITAAFTP